MNIPKGLKRRKDKKADFARLLVRAAIQNTANELFETRSAGELLFEGYDSPLLGLLKNMTKDPTIPDRFGLLSDVSLFVLALQSLKHLRRKTIPTLKGSGLYQREK